jgi:hypothetical protein
LSGQPALQRTDAIVNFDWAGARPDAALPADRFSARWSGRLAAPTSEAYTFYLYSNDGARLWVNNRLVIDRWQPPFEPQSSSAPVELKAGEKVDIRLEHYDAEGEALIQLLWSSASTPKQIIPRRYLYPEAATDNPTPTDAKQTGLLLPPRSDADPKATQPQPISPSRWLASPLGHAGLVLMIACGLLALLRRTRWRQSRRGFALAAMCSGVLLRLQDQIASRLGELSRIATAVSDKLQLVAVFGKRLFAGTYDKLKFAAIRKRLSRSEIGVGADLRVCPVPASPPAPGQTRRSAPTLRRLILGVLRLLAEASDKLKFVAFGKKLLAGTSDKLKFVGHFLAAFLPIFKVVSRGGAVVRLGRQKLVGLLPERVRAIA